MANRSTVAVHEFTPPALAPMMAIEPMIATRQLSVYLPPSYPESSDRNYPVIYLLHGNGQDHRTYFNPYLYQIVGMNLQSIMDEIISLGISQELIIVVPNGDLPENWIDSSWRGSFFVNSGHNGDFETYVAEDVVDCVESNTNHCLWDDKDEGYRVIPSCESRAILGICMGSLGALNMALRYPGTFAAAGGNFGMPSLNEFIFPYSDGVVPLMHQYFGNPDLQEFVDERLKVVYPAFDSEHYPESEYPIELGPEGEVIMTQVQNPDDPEGPEIELWSDFYLKHDPYTYLADHPEAVEGLSFYLDVGNHDSLQLYENNRAFSALLAGLGLDPSLDLGPDNRHFFEIYPSQSHVDLNMHDRVVKALTFLANHVAGED